MRQLREEVLAPLLGGAQAARLITELADLVGGAVFAVDPTWSVAYWDPSASRELGVRAEDAVGRHCLKSVQCAACLGGCAMPQGVPRLVHVRRADGSLGAYRQLFYPAPSLDGSFQGGVEVLLPAAAPPEPTEAIGGIETTDPELREAVRSAIRLAAARLPLHLECADRHLVLQVARAVHQAGGGQRLRAVDGAALSISDLEGSDPCPHCGVALLPRLAEDADTVLIECLEEVPWQAQLALARLIGHEWTCGRPARARLLTASPLALPDAVQAARLRPPLAAVLEVCRLVLPGLRQRPGDLDSLIQHHLHALQRPGLPPPKLSPEALTVLRGHDWRGGTQALRMALAWAVTHATGPTIRLEDLPPALRQAVPTGAPPEDERSVRAEAERLRQAIAQEGGNLTRAAKRLGISRAALWRRRRKYGV